MSGGQITAIAIAAALIIGIIAGAVTGHSSGRASVASPPATPGGPSAVPVLPSPPSVAPANSTDPAASVLSGLVAQQSDVTPTYSVVPLEGGQDTTQPTLDLCNGAFPSEALRTARLQVSVVDSQLNDVLSTEAVLYPHAGGTAQAFTELRSIAAACPSTPVASPVGEPTVTTRFSPAPDGSWPGTATVERLAYDFTITDATGRTSRSTAVYLRRGRALMGVYFSNPDGTQSALRGQTTITGIVGVFAGRMAALPASVVNG